MKNKTEELLQLENETLAKKLEQHAAALKQMERELEIEAALEKIRNRTMAMQKSEELTQVSQLLFEQLKTLGEPAEQFSIGVIREKEGIMELSATFQGNILRDIVTVALDKLDDFVMKEVYQAWKSGKNYLVTELHGKKLAAYNQFKNQLTGRKVFSENNLSEDSWVVHAVFFSRGMIALSTQVARPASSVLLLQRFAVVFDFAYTRFLDLKQVEALAKEAQIELGLERVRAKAMAMQNSEDVAAATAVMFQELSKLGIQTMRCGILFMHENKTMEVWNSYTDKEGGIRKVAGLLDMNIHPLLQQAFVAWRNKEEQFQYKLEGEDAKAYYTAIAGSATYQLPVYNDPANTHYCNIYFFEEGGIYTFTEFLHDDDVQSIIKKFTAVFSLTFRRYQDLKKAEAQTREAQIETALERVRSRTMGMHKSSDLLDVISVLSEQFQQLGFTIDSANFNTSYREKDWNLWLYNPGTPMYPDQIHIPYFDHPFFNRVLDTLAEGRDFDAFVFTREEKDAFFDHLYTNTLARNAPEERKKYSYEKPGFAWSIVYLKNTAITIANYDGEPYTEEQNTILRRFGNVFEQSYTRFLDLQKAEAQTIEAQIEAALERVRAKAMSMHNSEDIAATIGVFYHELANLQIIPRRCGIGVIDKETRYSEISSMNTSPEGNSFEVLGKVKLTGHPVLEGIFDNWLLQKEYRPVLRGKEINEYYQLLSPQISISDYPDDTVQYGYFFFFTEGGVYAWTDSPLTEQALKIFRKFTSVLNLTYKRYKDLKDAEIRTQLAVKEASLDRVRAEIASMRTAEDLQRITPLVWRELTTLGVPFFRCGVFIVDDEKRVIHFYLSSPDGKPLAALELGFDGADVTQQATLHWREQKIYTERWGREAFLQFAQRMLSQGQIQNISTYQGGEEAPESITLQFVPFAQGMMYVGSTEDLSAEQLELVKSLAAAFSTAYARYEDFTKLEITKQKVEIALQDLRATQNQLVQSEKMASLGELTAGIAHEIQNPLNFVNNFSEVSTELVEEMNEEILKGNLKDAQQVAKDLLENLKKINHHGKRAGDIVRSMLQHSRSGSGQKEPTDINALCDEYLRLAYHGLRAKDKSFNASFEMLPDTGIGRIPVVPQEMGRVILNLITNAFYAVSEKKKRSEEDYEPLVTVQTKREAGKILITVKDNGMGIPDTIREKIFQPFFTTKPAGKGTGLGLSMSYDIVTKGHGGQLTVLSEPGEYTAFMIVLPV